MTTKTTNEYPEIEWDIQELLEKDIDERSETYSVVGEDFEGNRYEGTAYFSCGELEEVKEIERILPPNN